MFWLLGYSYLVSNTSMQTRNLDLQKVTFLKIRNNSLSSLFWSVKFEIMGLYLSISTSLIFFFLLSNDKSGKLVIFYSKTYSDFGDWWFGKIINILKALIYLVKLLVNLTTFLHLGYIYNPDSVAIITVVYRVDC